MLYKKFEKSDLFYNIIKTRPRFEFKIWGGNVYLNNGLGQAILNDLGIGAGQCGAENILDFSCPETSYNVGII
jgi:hypothetical protein